MQHCPLPHTTVRRPNSTLLVPRLAPPCLAEPLHNAAAPAVAVFCCCRCFVAIFVTLSLREIRCLIVPVKGSSKGVSCQRRHAQSPSLLVVCRLLLPIRIQKPKFVIGSGIGAAVTSLFCTAVSCPSPLCAFPGEHERDQRSLLQHLLTCLIDPACLQNPLEVRFLRLSMLLLM